MKSRTTGLKMHAAYLDAVGDPSRAAWMAAAKAALEAVNADDAAAFRAGVAEVVACLANACRPLLKDKVRAVVGRFLKGTLGA